MTQVIDKAAEWEQRKQAWLDRVRALNAEIEGWARAEGWAVEHEHETVEDDFVGTYTAPALLLRPPGGELLVRPVTFARGRGGRVDLRAYPTLSRVKLLMQADGWQIMTDSNVPLRVPWNRETFVQLAADLLR